MLQWAPSCSCTQSMLALCVFERMWVSHVCSLQNMHWQWSKLEEVVSKEVKIQFYLACSVPSLVLWWPVSVQAILLCQRHVSSTIVVYHLSGWRDRKNEHKKKGDSFSPYQLGKAMLCPCNWVGISSINCATLDNKYRVHRQLLWDLKRGCVKEWVCVFVCVCGCARTCVLVRKNRTGAFLLINHLCMLLNRSMDWYYTHNNINSTNKILFWDSYSFVITIKIRCPCQVGWISSVVGLKASVLGYSELSHCPRCK